MFLTFYLNKSCLPKMFHLGPWILLTASLWKQKRHSWWDTNLPPVMRFKFWISLDCEVTPSLSLLPGWFSYCPIYGSNKPVWKLFIFNGISRNHMYMQTNYYWIGIAIWNPMIACKLFVFNRNTWDHLTASKLFLLNRNCYVIICLQNIR